MGSGKMDAYINGHVYVEKNVFCKAFLVEGNQIVATGTTSEILSRNPRTILDLKGKTVLPGFNDSHLHFLMTAEYLEMLPISDVTSMHELIERGRIYIREKNLTSLDFIYTEGWNQNTFTDEKRFPEKTDLDLISKEIPIVMGRVDRHVFSCNSAALAFFGVTRDTPSPEGGEIRKDADGEPTGVFTERAIDLIKAKMPKKKREEQKKLLEKTMKLANKQGITSMHTCDCKDNEIEETWSLYKELERQHALTIRFYHQMWFNDGKYLPSYFASGFKTGQGTAFNRVGPVKLFADGALGGRTAALRQDYHDDSGNKGVLTKPQETLNHEVQLAVENDSQVIIHAIGDQGITAVLDAYDAVAMPENRLRLGINHVQITDYELLTRIQKKGYLTYVQPIFLEDDIPIVVNRVGQKLASTSYAFGTMARMGIHQSFSTDAPIAPFQPFHNLYCAVTRKRLDGSPLGGFLPSEALDLSDAIDAYTLEGAYASFEEHTKGRLKKGYVADFIVLDRPIFSLSPEAMKDTTVVMTVVDGTVVYQKSMSN